MNLSPTELFVLALGLARRAHDTLDKVAYPEHDLAPADALVEMRKAKHLLDRALEVLEGEL